MTDDQHGEGTPQQGGQSGWERLPQGDYDDGATTFVQLPEGGIDALFAADSPLAAPGHGYVPPPIAPNPPGAAGTDPSGTGSWAMPAEGAQWHDPNAGQQQPPAQDGFTYNPGSTGQWTFEEPGAQEGTAPGHDVTGEWSIPVAGGDLPDESGEFSTSALVEQWGGTPPATLPGGAPAPWATEQIGTAWTAPPPPTRAEESAAGEPPADARAEAPGEPSSAPVEAPAPDASEETPEAPEGAQESAGGDEQAAEADGDSTGPQEPGTPAEASDAETPDAEDAGAADPAAEPTPPPHDDHPLASYVLSVNGADRPVTDAWIGESLLYVLRERLGLAGAKDGCSQGECGACNVQVDGRLVASCLVPAVTAASSEVRTVEGLAVDGQPSDVQRALARCGAVQCGFCVPGMAMTVHDLLEGNPAPTELEARQALCGNLCRCSGYRGVLAAVRDVVAERAAHAAGDGDTGADTDEARIPHQAGPGAGGVNPAAYEAQGTPPQVPNDPGQSYGGQGLSFGGQDDTYGGQGQSFGGHGDTYGGQGQSFGGQDQSFGGQGDTYGGQGQSFGGHDDSYGGQGQSFGGHGDTYGGQGQSFGGQDQSFGGQDQSFGGQDDTYGGQGQSFGGHDDTYGGQGRNFGDQDQSFGQDGGQA
ncbi:(2Fe-2S)-binding protein [Streptomyces sp. JV178]|uniref:2Fe-2S iron-sulfur cluster-binding protein n=1 Tax=Streptomyces sp. JV178 TaxID=858632 RepID=UPI000C1B1988|nr:2Fe-2S iron-sulfur cluster-binding protein [Streptomyces sp. JV178]PIM73778.1 (2Fe-2S)-binding protein [Streptomyces sp. JV178]